MPSPYDELNQQFHKASLRTLAKQNLNDHEWNQFQKITERFEKIHDTTEQQHNEHYTLRVDQEHRRLLRERTSPQRHLKYPAWMGYDQLSPQSLKAQAQLNVDKRHDQRLASLNKREKEVVDRLLEKSQTRQQRKGEPTQNFNQATNRRTGIDRRQAPTQQPKRRR